MKHPRPYSTLLAVALVSVAGCSHDRVRSTAPADASSRRARAPAPAASTALVRNNLDAGPKSLDVGSISISQHLGGGCLFGRRKERELFASGEGGMKPDGYVAVTVPADGRVRLVYWDARKGGVCSFGIEATLKPDGRYSLRGGPAYIDGPIPILTGGGGCALGIVDEESGLPVEAKKLTMADYCTRAKPPPTAP